MARYALKNKESGIVDNIIEAEAEKITTTFIKDALGNKHPTSMVDGELQMTDQYLIPDGYELVETDKAIVGQTWPLPEPEVVEETADNPTEEIVAEAPTKKSKKTT